MPLRWIDRSTVACVDVDRYTGRRGLLDRPGNKVLDFRFGIGLCHMVSSSHSQQSGQQQQPLQIHRGVQRHSAQSWSVCTYHLFFRVNLNFAWPVACPGLVKCST
jgi:hypothetical protein